MGSDAKPVVVTEKTIGGEMAIEGEVGIKEWNVVECFELSLVSHGGSFLSKATNQKTTRNELKKILITCG